MPDNWGYVFSAYGLAAVALLCYWRRLAGRAKRLAGRGGGTGEKKRRAAENVRQG